MCSGHLKEASPLGKRHCEISFANGTNQRKHAVARLRERGERERGTERERERGGEREGEGERERVREGGEGRERRRRERDGEGESEETEREGRERGREGERGGERERGGRGREGERGKGEEVRALLPKLEIYELLCRLFPAPSTIIALVADHAFLHGEVWTLTCTFPTPTRK